MKSSTSKFWAIVPAAGLGERFSGSRPKQFHQLRGKTVAEHTLEKLLSIKLIERLICPCDISSPYWSGVSVLKDSRIEMVSGGITRADSVMNGLVALQKLAKADDWVLVHDALALAKKNNMNPTDEASAVEAVGRDVLMIEGRKDNIKLTHQEDLVIAESILKAQEENLCV